MEPQGPTSSKLAGGQRRLVAIFLISLVLIAVAFGAYYIQSSETVSSLRNSVGTESSQLSALSREVAAEASALSNLTASISSLRSALITEEQLLSNLTSRYAQAKSTIAALNTTLAGINAQVTTLKERLSYLTAIVGLSESSELVGSETFRTNSSGLVKVVSFTANYSGYISIVATTASDLPNEGAEVRMQFASNINSPSIGEIYLPNEHGFTPFGSLPCTEVFPILPGTISVYLYTSDLTSQNATLSITYVY